MKEKITKYVPEVCVCCGQDTTYQISLDKGCAIMLAKMAQFIKKKRLNIVHPRKEMEGIHLTSNQVGNLSHLRFHGLIARHPDSSAGNYSITRKGFEFLSDHPVVRTVIVKKAKVEENSQTIGYDDPLNTITFQELLKEKEYWSIFDGYEVREGRVVSTTQLF